MCSALVFLAPSLAKTTCSVTNRSMSKLSTSAEFISNNTVIDETGEVLRIGGNQAGRCAFDAANLDSPFEISGSVVEDGWRWVIILNNINDSLVENNLIYEAAGAGIVTKKAAKRWQQTTIAVAARRLRYSVPWAYTDLPPAVICCRHFARLNVQL